jgi:hypothetical protein
MSAGYASNCPISRPNPVAAQYPPHINLNGIGFNYDIGLVYMIVSDDFDERIQQPAPGAIP